MATTWSPDELERIERAAELLIATRRAEGTLRRWVPIWVVCDQEQVYVRTWYRRETGWFGHALRSRRGRIRVPGLEVDVTVVDLGSRGEARAGVDIAYRTKYGPGASADRMVTNEAAATTLQLIHERREQAPER